MKNKLYYVLFFVYVLMFAFILYINGVFTGETTGMVNLLINVGFLTVIGVLFGISAFSFSRLNRCTDELVAVTEQMQRECKEANGKNLWAVYQERKDLFVNEQLRLAFNKYRLRMKGYKTKRGYVNTCDLEEYINENLLDRVGMTFFNSGMSGTLTGLGILGTFLGLTMGLGSFDGNDIFTISDNVGPLLSGMKVAFHTSVYGIFFSLVFNFVYRSIMADAYDKLENFLNAFRQFAMPPVATEDENAAAMLVYQANMANSMKQMMELLKGNAMEQTSGVERIVEHFMTQMDELMGVQFRQLGSALNSAGEAQKEYADSSRELLEATASLIEMNRDTRKTLSQIMDRQEVFAKELKAQKEKLTATCDEISNDVSNQLYTFEQMRSMYEK